MQKEDRCIHPVRTTHIIQYIKHTLWTTTTRNMDYTHPMQFPQSQLKSIIPLNTTWFSKLSLIPFTLYFFMLLTKYKHYAPLNLATASITVCPPM